MQVFSIAAFTCGGHAVGLDLPWWQFVIAAGPIFVVILGHLWYALRDPGALSGMFLGHITPEWAARHHPAWLDEARAPEPPRAGASGIDGPAPPGMTSTGNFAPSGEPTGPGGKTEEGNDDLSPRRS